MQKYVHNNIGYMFSFHLPCSFGFAIFEDMDRRTAIAYPLGALITPPVRDIKQSEIIYQQ